MIKLGVYQHYKGNYYEVIGECRHSETLEKFVVYRALYGEKGLWVRPYDMFLEKISSDGTNFIARFKYVNLSKQDLKNQSISSIFRQ